MDKRIDFYTPATGQAFDFDPTYNRLYFLKRDAPTNDKKSWGGRKDNNEAEHYSNLLIWDVATQKKHVLLTEALALTHDIRGCYYEHHYDEEKKTLFFNRQLTTMNYANLEQHKLNDALLLLTIHRESNRRYLWLAHKSGQGLREVAQLSKGDDWHLDVGNRVLRIIEHQKRDLYIKEIPWQAPS